MILLWVVWNKNKNKFIYEQSGLEETYIVFVESFFILRSHDISLHKHNSCVLPILIKHITCSCYIMTYYGLSYMISAVWSLNRDHRAGTNFLYKIIPRVNLKNIHQINIKCIVCNTNNKYSCLICPCRAHSLILVGIIDSSSGLVRYSYSNTTRVFSKDRLNTH